MVVLSKAPACDLLLMFEHIEENGKVTLYAPPRCTPVYRGIYRGSHPADFEYIAEYGEVGCVMVDSG